MAEFLITADISARLQKIIREADERLVLISPYLKLNPRIRELLEQKSRTKTHVRIIYGKIELPPEERKWIDSVPAIELCFRQSLHAKCYLNEKEAILTSMNLHQFSEQNNDEMGIVVTNNLWDDKDRELYNKISAQAEEIAYFSQKIREVPRSGPQGLAGQIKNIAKDVFSKLGRNGPPGGETTAADKSGLDTKESEDRQADVIQTRSEGPQPDPPVAGAPQIPTTGFCIRCKTEIPANPVQPYCDRHLRIWKRFENDDYPENYCHICGIKTATSRRKPLCRDCYRSYKEVFTFAVSRD